MDTQEINRLRYRRQYLLAPKEIECPFVHIRVGVGESCYLYAHIDLPVNKLTIHGTTIILLGDIFDFEYTQKSNEDLLHDLIDEDLHVFLEKTSRYTGRFVLIYSKDGELFFITDAASSRKVYYCQTSEGTWCASQPHLLANTLNLKITDNPSKLLFYNSPEYKRLNNSNIGNTTCYDAILQLIPNHYLSYSDCKTLRFWPNKTITSLPLDDVVESCSKMISGYINSIGYRYKIMLPVTSGKDSRLLLSATYDIKDKVYYYINKEEGLTDKHNDIVIPRSLMRKLNLDYHVLNPYIKIDPDFEKVYFENNPFASERYLPIIYNYYVHFSDKVNLPGIFVNVVEDVYLNFNKKITPELLAAFINLERFEYAGAYFSYWLENSQALCEQHNLDLLRLLYWEERIANWGTQTQLDKDIAQEDIIPYNSRSLIETMLSIKLKYREKPDYLVFSEITRKLWPETLQEPCNPEFMTNFMIFIKRIGMMDLVKRIYYSLNGWFKRKGFVNLYFLNIFLSEDGFLVNTGMLYW